MRLGVLAVILGALLLVGCGDDDQSDAERRQDEAQVEGGIQKARLDALLEVKREEMERRKAHPNQVLAPDRYRGALAERYETDREICSAISPSELADNFDLDSDDPETVAEAYSESFPGKYRRAAAEGCLAGFE